MNKKKVLAVALTAMMTASLFTGCGSKSTGDTSKKQLSLTIYAGLMEDHANAVAKEFEKETEIGRAHV